MKSEGFTLIEVLIGLFIAVIASVSVAQVIASTNKVVDAGRKTFVATNIAHEGLELTREIRDDTWLSNANRAKWMSLSGLCPDTATHTYTIDPEMARVHTVQNDSQQALYKQSNGEWTHNKNSGTNTGYSRLMTIDCSNVDAVPAYVTVTSTVTWTGADAATRNVFIKEQLYNWLP